MTTAVFPFQNVTDKAADDTKQLSTDDEAGREVLKFRWLLMVTRGGRGMLQLVP